MLFGQLRGSIGDVTFARVGGQQISRSRNRKPSNPRSDNQMASRVFLKTASMAYSMLAANLGNQTFQGAKVGAENQRRFIQRNVALLRQNANNADYNFAPSGAITAPANSYIIAEGNLPSVNLINVTNSGFAIGDSSWTAPNSTYAEVCDGLGLPYGAQLTFAIVRGGNDGYMSEVIRQRIILSPSTGDMNTPFLHNDGSINLPNPSNEVTMMSVVAGSGITFATLAQNVIAVGVVPSYYEGSGWRYGFSQLRYIGTGYLTLNDAITSFQPAGAKERLFPDEELYTRQANESADLVDYSGSVTSLLLRVYQYSENEGFAASRRLVGSIEANGNLATVLTDGDWVEGAGLDTIAVEAEWFGSMPRTFNEENLYFPDPEVVDESAIIIPLKYNAGKKSYNVVARLLTNADGLYSIGLKDNNGNIIGTANFNIQGAPQVLRITSVEVTDDRPFSFQIALTGEGFVSGQTAIPGSSATLSVDAGTKVLSCSSTGSPVSVESLLLTVGNVPVHYTSREGSTDVATATLGTDNEVIISVEFSG